MVDDETLADADFTNVTSVETLTAATNKNITAVLGAAASASGLETVTLTDTGAAESVTIGAGFATDLSVSAGDVGHANTIDATGMTGVLTVTATGPEFTVAHNVTGGSSTSDELVVTVKATDDTILLTNVTAVEKITTSGADGDITMVVPDAAIAAGATLTIDGTSLNDDALNVDASADTNGTVYITADGTGTHTVSLGAGDDTFTSVTATATSVDNITATAGDNTISTGGGDDVIVLGTGNDTVNAGDDDDTIQTLTANFTADDTLDGGDGDDSIVLTDDATVIDSDFTAVTNTEILTASAATINLNATLGALAAAAGIDTVTMVDTTAANTITLGAGFTNAVTVNIADDAAAGHTVAASAYTGVLTVAVGSDFMDSNASTLTGGTGTSDVLSIISGGNAPLMTSVTGFENINTSDASGAITITLVDGNVAAGKAVTIDVTSLDNDVATINASAETDGTVTILADGTGDHQITLGQGNDTYTSTSTAGEDVTATAGNNTISTGDGDDVIVLGTGNDTVNAGDDDDSIQTSTANFTANDTLNGGDGDDSIVLTDDATIIDSDFTSVTNTEILTGSAATVNLNATLGALAAAAGIDTVTMIDTTAANTITLAAGFTNDVTVNIADDAAAGHTVAASAYTGVLTVSVGTDFLDSNASTLTGGTGTSDVLSFISGGNAPLLTNVTGFENINTSDASGAIAITLVDGNVAAGKAVTIDVTSLDNDVATINASAEADGDVTILADGTGDHQITLGQGDDTYTSTSSAGEDVTATAGSNTISTGAGADIITSGSGVDTITGGTGANVLILKAVALNTTTVDVITDFTTATWDIDIDLSDIGTLLDIKDSTDLAAADNLAFETITAAFDLGGTTSNDSILVANLAGNIASTDALETALEFGGDLQLTSGGAITVGEKFLVAYDDGTDTYIAEVSVGVATPDNTAFGIGSLVAQNLVKLTGVDDVTDLAAGDIDVIA
jgi:hypothetical protein